MNITVLNTYHKFYVNKANKGKMNTTIMRTLII